MVANAPAVTIRKALPMTPSRPQPSAAPAAPAPFDLTRRFSVAALVSVIAIAGTLALALSRLLGQQLMHRDAVITQEFVQSIARTDETAPYFAAAGTDARAPVLEDSFRHFAQMPDVLRANVYGRERGVIWSSDPDLVGRRFGANEELDRALAGELVYKSGVARKEEHVAGSHAFPETDTRQFVEIYAPVRGPDGAVVGVVELYKTPLALFLAIRDGQRTVVLVAAAGGLLLYGVLIGIVRQADRTLRDQQRRLVEGERLAAVGEMAATVAHAIRNPLSSIRTSVELALDHDPGKFAEPAEDIVSEVDRMEAWVRQLLAFSRTGSVARDPLDPNALVLKALAACDRQGVRQGVRVETALATPSPAARGDAALIEHVLMILVANALDAMPAGGTLAVTTRDDAGGCEIAVRDSGAGIRPADLSRVFEPFFTTKSRGTGLGLALARRSVEHMGGSLTLENAPGAGAVARLRLPA
jgi:signal transduction histidine kinase